MRFAVLGSGSKGNGTLVEHQGTSVLVDCGFSLKETERRLARLGRQAADLAGVIVTHEHSDHICGVAQLARKYALPVWATQGTAASRRFEDGVEVRVICSHSAFAIGALAVQPFPVPHDAREPSQFVFSDGDRRLGLLTDTGSATAHIEAQLSGCDALILECNHERELLEQGDYPWSLKQRVGGDQGHLSNAQAAAILGGLDNRRLKHLVAAHLSEKHNTPALARAALADALGCAVDWVAVADQEQGLGWRDV